jgi:Secretion system C-terminal sorting domain
MFSRYKKQIEFYNKKEKKMKRLIITLAVFFALTICAFGQTSTISSPDGRSIGALAVAPNGNILAGTANGIYRSEDNGTSWIRLWVQLEDPYISPTGDSIYVMSIGVTDSLIFFDAPNYLFVLSAVTGQSVNTPNGSPGSNTYFASSGSNLVGFHGDIGVLSLYNSTDNGFTWAVDTIKALNQNSQATGFAVTDSGYFYAISYRRGTATLGPIYTGVAFSKTFGSLTMSNFSSSFDSLVGWAWPDSSSYGLMSVGTRLFTAGDTVFAVVDTFGMSNRIWKTFYTIDAAKTWHQATSLPSSVSAVAYGIVNANPTYESSRSKRFVTNSQTSSAIRAVGTTDGKVYVNTSSVTAVRPPVNQVPGSFKLSQNFPNPFNPSTQISYSVPKSGTVMISVYNTLGQKVATLFYGEASAGKHIATFNADRYASGVYFCRMEAAGFSQTVKMMLMK